MKKVLVLGKKGMLGHTVYKYLTKYKPNIEVEGLSRRDLDIENLVQTRDYFYRQKDFDYIVNCIGILVDKAEEDKAKTVHVNSWFPKFLEETYKNTKTKIIQISTDCVFNGSRGYYIEVDTPNETNLYGKSKALGEIVNDKDVTFRTSIIGTELKEEGSGLLNWVLTTPQSEITGWEDSKWNGITTLELAKIIAREITLPYKTGIWHVVDRYNITNKYTLVYMINKVFDVGHTVKVGKGPKPINKILLNTKIPFSFPDYIKQLKELKNFSETT